MHYVKNILNLVIGKFKNIHISHIATTVKEAIEIISHNYIDLIFLDLKLPDSEGTEIIEKVKTLNEIKQPEIVIISRDMTLINNVKKTYKNLNVISKLSSGELIYREIQRIVYEMNYIRQKEQIEKIITSELMKIGYDFKYKGTLYMFETINHIYRNNNLDLLDNLEKMFILM